MICVINTVGSVVEEELNSVAFLRFIPGRDRTQGLGLEKEDRVYQIFPFQGQEGTLAELMTKRRACGLVEIYIT